MVGALKLGPDYLPTSVQGRTLAVGTSILYGSVSENYKDLQALTHSLRCLSPVDRTATFLIYRIPLDGEMAAANKAVELTQSVAP